MTLSRTKAFYGKVTVKVCADGSVIRYRRCLQCDSLMVLRPHESVRQTCSTECKRKLFWSRSRVSGRPDYSSKVGFK